MKINNLSLKDKKVFKEFLALERHNLAAYAFENIYIWKNLFDISWIVIQDNLCVFFRDKIGSFMYLAPQGEKISPEAVLKSFKIMDGLNKNKDISRIENVEAKDVSFYQSLGYAVKEKFGDYLCERIDLTQLKGNDFKSKRAVYNYFIKNYQFEYLPFILKYKADCLQLYNEWMKARQANNSDNIYTGMLQDSRTCLNTLLDNYADLNFTGSLARIDGQIRAFTFGFKLNQDTFCILYEITDLSIKGLAQFIFRQFCRELTEYKYINIMDDSGLENLKKVKLSYRPLRLIPAYIVTRKNEPRPSYGVGV